MAKKKKKDDKKKSKRKSSRNKKAKDDDSKKSEEEKKKSKDDEQKEDEVKDEDKKESKDEEKSKKDDDSKDDKKSKSKKDDDDKKESKDDDSDDGETSGDDDKKSKKKSKKSKKSKKKDDKDDEDDEDESDDESDDEEKSKKDDRDSKDDKKESKSEKKDDKKEEKSEKKDSTPEAQPQKTAVQVMEEPQEVWTAKQQKEYKEGIDDDVLAAMDAPGPMFYAALTASALVFVLGLVLPLAIQTWKGFGVTGINNPVGWGAYITTFVFWVGIAHSGTLISAVLFLFRAKFRSSFNRSAEAMTIFAVATAGLFPLIHIGRLWVFYYLLPYPNQRQLWINFRSPLIWDVFAINTYLTVSVIFWYVGLIPDLAIIRNRAKGLRKWIYGIFALGWRGTDKQWKHYNQVYLFLAAFATPLVVSVHSVVSWDFAMGLVPGWHTTIFPPYFVAGAIFSGCAMVLTLVIPMRKIFKLEKHLPVDHFDALAKLLLVTGMVVFYSYMVEIIIAFYSGHVYEVAIFNYRPTGDYWFAFWLMIMCNCISPLTLFVTKLRRNLTYLFILSIFVNIGMWLERYNIIVTSLSHEFNPYAWDVYSVSLVEGAIVVGSFGFFFMLFLLFCKVLPVIAITEVKEIEVAKHVKHHHHH